MLVEVLFFEGCPHHQPTVEMVRASIADLGLNAEVREVQVCDHDAALRLRFLGSPSVRVEGIDIEPGVHGREDFALSCRMYGGSGVPPRELVANALRGACRVGGGLHVAGAGVPGGSRN
jgi:hypothetical protein